MKKKILDAFMFIPVILGSLFVLALAACILYFVGLFFYKAFVDVHGQIGNYVYIFPGVIVFFLWCLASFHYFSRDEPTEETA